MWFISTQESLDTNSPFWNAMLWILWVFAELEKDMIQERTSWWRTEAKKAWRRSQDVFWYNRDKELKPHILKEEADLIVEIFEMFVIQKMKPTHIAKDLSERKILVPWARSHRRWHKKVKKQFFWRTKTIKEMLENEVYIWKFYFWKSKTVINRKTKKKKSEKVPKEDRTLSEVKHERIIDNKTFEKAQELLAQKTTWRTQPESEYILSWLIRCDDCKNKRSKDTGLSHWTWGNSHWTQYYKCNWRSTSKHQWQICSVKPLPRDNLEAIVIHFIKSFFEDPRAIVNYLDKHSHLTHNQKFNRKKIEDAIKAHNKVVQQIENNKELFKSWDITKYEYYKDKKDFENKMKITNKKVKEAENELWMIVDANRYSQSFKMIWKIMKAKLPKVFGNKIKLKKLLNLLIEEIVIYSRKKWVNEKIPWRAKEWQRIPKRIVIKFRLPQEFLNELFEYEQLRQREYLEAHRNLELNRLNWIIDELRKELKIPKSKSKKSKKSKSSTTVSPISQNSSIRPLKI